MPLPWLRILDLVLTMTDVARAVNRRSLSASRGDGDEQLTSPPHRGTQEAGLATLVGAALKEAFNRDRHRLEFEREQREEERRRAERLLKVEIARQAGDREIGRLRLLAGMALVGLLASLVFAGVIGSAGIGTRMALGTGWSLLLAAITTAVNGQSAVAASLTSLSDKRTEPQTPSSGPAGAATLWLLIAGLAVVSGAVLVR
jgi:hypothetical protein